MDNSENNGFLTPIVRDILLIFGGGVATQLYLLACRCIKKCLRKNNTRTVVPTAEENNTDPLDSPELKDEKIHSNNEQSNNNDVLSEIKLLKDEIDEKNRVINEQNTTIITQGKNTHRLQQHIKQITTHNNDLRNKNQKLQSKYKHYEDYTTIIKFNSTSDAKEQKHQMLVNKHQNSRRHSCHW